MSVDTDIAEMLAADTPEKLKALVDRRLIRALAAALETDTERILYGTGEEPNIVGVLYVKRKRTRAKHERRQR